MRCLQRNKRTIWYAPYVRTDEVKDEYGNVIGHTPVYGDPMQTSANWSASVGQAEVELFGNAEQYDRVIVMDKTMPVLTEQTILWIDKAPSDGAYNYIVKKVADSINGYSYAVRKVDVSE